MKKEIKIGSLIFLLLFFACVNSVAQHTSESTYNYYVFNTELGNEVYQEYEVYQLCIYNNTKEKMLLWFEKDKTIQEAPVKDKVKKYFFSVKGDFSLINIMTEYGSTLMGFKTEIFHTFYKIIEPEKKFLIQVIYKAPNNENVVDLLEKMLVITTPSILEKEKINIFMISGIDRLSFGQDAIVVDGEQMFDAK